MNINRVRSAPIAVYEDVQMALHLDTEVLKAWRVVKTRAVKTIEGVESAGEVLVKMWAWRVLAGFGTAIISIISIIIKLYTHTHYLHGLIIY